MHDYEFPRIRIYALMIISFIFKVLLYTCSFDIWQSEEPPTVASLLHSLGLGKYAIIFQAEEVKSLETSIESFLILFWGWIFYFDNIDKNSVAQCGLWSNLQFPTYIQHIVAPCLQFYFVWSCSWVIKFSFPCYIDIDHSKTGSLFLRFKIFVWIILLDGYRHWPWQTG